MVNSISLCDTFYVMLSHVEIKLDHENDIFVFYVIYTAINFLFIKYLSKHSVNFFAVSER